MGFYKGQWWWSQDRPFFMEPTHSFISSSLLSHLPQTLTIHYWHSWIPYDIWGAQKWFGSSLCQTVQVPNPLLSSREQFLCHALAEGSESNKQFIQLVQIAVLWKNSTNTQSWASSSLWHALTTAFAHFSLASLIFHWDAIADWAVSLLT